MFDPVAKARYNAWKQLGKLSRIEAMVMYAQAIEDVSPRWWAWPALGFVPAAEGEEEGGEVTTVEAVGAVGAGAAAAAAAAAAGAGAKVVDADAEAAAMHAFAASRVPPSPSPASTAAAAPPPPAATNGSAAATAAATSAAEAPPPPPTPPPPPPPPPYRPSLGGIGAAVDRDAVRD